MSLHDSKQLRSQKPSTESRDQSGYTSVLGNSLIRDTVNLTVKDILQNEIIQSTNGGGGYDEPNESRMSLQSKNKSQASIQRFIDSKAKSRYSNNTDHNINEAKPCDFLEKFDKLDDIDIDTYSVKSHKSNVCENNNLRGTAANKEKSRITSCNNSKNLIRIEAPSTNSSIRSPKNMPELTDKYVIEAKSNEKAEAELVTQRRLDRQHGDTIEARVEKSGIGTERSSGVGEKSSYLRERSSGIGERQSGAGEKMSGVEEKLRVKSEKASDRIEKSGIVGERVSSLQDKSVNKPEKYEKSGMIGDKSGFLQEKLASRSEKSSIGADKPNIVTEKSGLIAEKSNILAEKCGMMTEKSGMLTEKSSVLAEKSSVLAEKQGILAENSGILAEKSATRSEKSGIPSEKPITKSEKSITKSEKSGIAPEKSTIPKEKSLTQVENSLTPLEKPSKSATIPEKSVNTTTLEKRNSNRQQSNNTNKTQDNILPQEASLHGSSIKPNDRNPIQNVKDSKATEGLSHLNPTHPHEEANLSCLSSLSLASKSRYLILNDIKAYDKEAKCHNHPIEDLQYYCFTNQECLCVECMLRDNHSHHDVQNLHKARERIQQNVDELFLSIRNKIDVLNMKEKKLCYKRQEFIDIVEQAKQLIHANFEELHKLLEKKEQELIKSVSNGLKGKLTEIEGCSKVVKERIQAIKQVQNVVNKHCQSMNDPCFCEYFSTKIAKINDFIIEDDDIKLDEIAKLDKLHSIIDNQSLKTMINQLQYIKTDLEKKKSLPISTFITDLPSQSTQSHPLTSSIQQPRSSNKTQDKVKSNIEKSITELNPNDEELVVINSEEQRILDFNKKYKELAESLQGSRGRGHKEISPGKDEINNLNTRSFSFRQQGQCQEHKRGSGVKDSGEYHQKVPRSLSNSNLMTKLSKDLANSPSKSIENLMKKFRKIGLGNSPPSSKQPNTSPQREIKYKLSSEGLKSSLATEDNEKPNLLSRLKGANSCSSSISSPNLLKSCQNVVFHNANQIISTTKKSKAEDNIPSNGLLLDTASPILLKKSYQAIPSSTISTTTNSVMSCATQRMTETGTGINKEAIMNTPGGDIVVSLDNNPVLGLLTKQKAEFYQRMRYNPSNLS